MMSIVVWAQEAIFTHVISDDVDDWDRWFLGKAPRTRETLPGFHESCRVALHSRVFHGLTGSQRIPRVLGHHKTCPNNQLMTTSGSYTIKMSKNGPLGPYINTHNKHISTKIYYMVQEFLHYS